MGEKEVRIAVRAAGLNFPDLLMTKGGYQFRPDPPFVPGVEAAGDIVEIGPGVARFAVGDKVIAPVRMGAFAEQAVALEDALFRLPPVFSYEEGACWFVSATTAWHALNDKADIQPGETLLVLGASGGVGMAAVQLGVHKGARVIGLASSKAKAQAIRAAGAEAAFLNDQPDLIDAVKAATGGKGVDVVYDPVGGPLATAATRMIGWNGRYLVVGFASGEIPNFPANHALIKGYSIMGLRAGEAVRRDPALGLRTHKALADLAELGVMRPHISHRVPLDEAGKVFAAMEERAIIGRAVILP
ncbi:MAG: NADPH:quinone oxidoreductase family protein [Chakrabartia sp.]